MAHVAIFHSVHGRRPAELTLGGLLREDGHTVEVPDLYDGESTEDIDEGFALSERVGWDTIVERATAALDAMPAETVLVGVSMGAALVGDLWPTRPDAAAVVLLHAVAEAPPDVRVPVQVHVAVGDRFAPEPALSALAPHAVIYRYPDAGHFFTDAAGPDHDAEAAALAVGRVRGLLRTL
ncbi:MAG TPA: dienelactone hydrolase family protein [Phytomonospora sp.]